MQHLQRLETNGNSALVSADEAYPPVRYAVLLPKKIMDPLMRPRNGNGAILMALATSLDLYDRTCPDMPHPC